jgi:hypothetical protein
MRITSRTPPVRIAAADMMALASLPAEHAGLLLRWGMRRYAEGLGVSVEDARAEADMDQRAWGMFMHVAKPFLDPVALDLGNIVVEAFARAADNLARVSAAKVRTPVSKEIAAKAIMFAATRAAGGTQARPRSSVARDADGDVPPVSAEGAPSVHITAAPSVDGDEGDDVAVAPPKRRRSPAAAEPADAWTPIAGEFVKRGCDPADVAATVSRWRDRYAPEDVVDCLQSITQRRIAKPLNYVDTMLTNMLTARRSGMPAPVRNASEGSLLPRPVKRRIRVGPRSGWHFEGWTAKGHQRGGETVEDRREVWRNEAGGLSYNKSDPDSTRPIPTYEEDPGLYETD